MLRTPNPKPPARWIESEDEDGEARVTCSACGDIGFTEQNPTLGTITWLSPYCPNCGAKMERSKAS